MIKSLSVGKRPYFHNRIPEGDQWDDYRVHTHGANETVAKERARSLQNSALAGQSVKSMVAERIGKDMGGNIGWAVGIRQ